MSRLIRPYTVNILSESLKRKQKPRNKNITEKKIQNQEPAPTHPKSRCQGKNKSITAMAIYLHHSPAISSLTLNSNIAEAQEKEFKRNYRKMIEVFKKEINKSLKQIQGNANK